MANTRKADLNTGFENEEYLYSIRQDLLNPLAARAAENKRKIDIAYPIALSSFTGVKEDLDKQQLTFHKDSGDYTISLGGMFDETKEIKVDGAFVEDITFTDASKQVVDKKATISFDWKDLVPKNQEHLTVGKTGSSTTAEPKALYFKGDNVTVTNTTGGITTVEVAQAAKLSAQIAEGVDKTINKIKVTGNIDGTSIVDEMLTITIPSGGGGGTVTTEGYFRGFFETLGDVESKVQDPTPGKTLVFVKDHLYPGSKYYNSYFYTNSGWTEVPTDPAITYTPATSSTIQGVFSIKPDPRITIDAKGQLDLGGLATDEAKLNFHGFYDTQAELESAVPRPIQDKSFAYVKHENGAWIGKVYRQTQTGLAWQPMVPISGLSFVESTTDLTNPGVIYGIAKNDDWEIGSNGILSLKGKEATLGFEVTKPGSSDLLSGDFKTIQFRNSRSNVFYNASTKKLSIEHPQQVIQYDSDFEDDHNGDEFKGNIFYDETSRCWMGWGIPTAANGVDAKWTRIIHPKMSDEVKDLSKRLPVKAPDVVAGVLGDAPAWQYTGWTYVDKDDNQLPEDFRSRCGAYISTVIQDVPDDTPRPQERLQICYADEQGGHCYVRTWNKGTSAGGTDYGWRPWVKISMSGKDIEDHNLDPGAHSTYHKFYKVLSPDMTYQALKAKNYYLYDQDMLLMADSYGSSNLTADNIVIPYDGMFRFSGKFTFDGWGASGTNTQWIFKIFKANGSTTTEIGDFTFNHTSTSTDKYMPPIQWSTTGISLKANDKVVFQLHCLSDTTFASNHPNLYLVPLRSYIAIEDEHTYAGSRIAEMHRRTAGMINATKTTGVNVHYASGSAGTIRVYGAEVNNTFANMTKIKG